MADNNSQGLSWEEALALAPVTEAEPTGLSWEDALALAPAPETMPVEDRGFFPQMGRGVSTGIEQMGTVPAQIGLQADSPIIAKARQYLGAYTQLEQGATAEDLAAGSEGALNLEQLQRYQEGTEEERQKLREFSETTSEQAMARTGERLSTIAESQKELEKTKRTVRKFI